MAGANAIAFAAALDVAAAGTKAVCNAIRTDVASYAKAPTW